MNLRFVETFVWVARLGSFRAAADRLNATQAAVSNRIASLEAEMGCELFERVPGGNHFISDGPVEPLLASLEACIPARTPWRLHLPALPRLAWPKLRLGGRTAQA